MEKDIFSLKRRYWLGSLTNTFLTLFNISPTKVVFLVLQKYIVSKNIKKRIKIKKQTLKRLQTKTKKVDSRSEEKRERKTRGNTRTQMPSKIGTQKKCAIFEKSNAVKGGSFDPSKTTALFCANLACLSKDFLLLIGELSLH